MTAQQSFARLWAQIEDELGMNDANMRRDRPYSGQPHTTTGERGRQEIKGITFRDLRDCFVRAVLLSAGHLVPHLYEEARKGEGAALCENDLYGWDINQLDPMAVCQNLSCEIERAMGIFPNVPTLITDTPPIRMHRPVLTVGDYSIAPDSRDTVWIEHASGEGGQFPRALLAAAVGELYRKHF